jgi:hypothetical protein
MIISRVSIEIGWGIVLALAFTRPDIAHAQGVVHINPLFGVSQMYDTNPFLATSNPQADFVTRVSPGVETEYRSPLMTLFGRYTQDVERFRAHPELSSAGARARAGLDAAYHPSRRFALAGGVEWSTTHTPGELNGETGLTFTRAVARRIAARSSVVRQLGRGTAGAIDYTFTGDRLGEGFRMRNHAATFGAERHLSSRNTLTTGYRIQQFVFRSEPASSTATVDAPATAERMTSHALDVGWVYAITRQASLSIAAGPQVTNGSPAAEISASLQYRMRPFDLTFAYARKQTTIIGLAGTADTQSVTGSAAWTLPRPSLRVRLSPSFFQNTHTLMREHVYRLTMGVDRPIVSGLSLNVALDTNVQSGNRIGPLVNDRIARHVVTIGLVAAPAVRD